MKKTAKIKLKNLNDPMGIAIKFLLLVILLYQIFIQRYFEVSGVIPALSAILLVLTFMDAKCNVANLFRDMPKSMMLMMIYFVLTLIFCFFNAIDTPQHFSTGFMVLEFSIPMISSLYLIKTRNEIDFIMNIFIVICGLLVITFLLNPQIVSEADGTTRLSVEGLNANSLALYASYLAWAVLYKHSQKKWILIISILFVGLATAAVILTGSRKGFISLGIVVIGWLIFEYLPSDKENIVKKIIVIAAIVAIICFVLIPQLTSSGLWKRFQTFTDQGTENRLDMYEKGLEYLKQNPLLGMGFDGFKSHYGYYSHSNIVEVFVSSGIPLGILYYVSILTLFIERIISKRKMKRNGVWSQHKSYYRMTSILFLTIIVSMFYIIHIYDMASFYLLSIIMASPIIARCEKNDKTIINNKSTPNIQGARHE